jgi:hypothetical protein
MKWYNKIGVAILLIPISYVLWYGFCSMNDVQKTTLSYIVLFFIGLYLAMAD